MKKISMLLLVLFFSSAAVLAQSPAPEPDTLKTVKQTDPEAKNPPSHTNYRTDQIKITPSEIPAGVKRALESSSQYAGWEKASIFKSKAGDLYTVEISRADTTR